MLPEPSIIPNNPGVYKDPYSNPVLREEFEKLKSDMEELKELLRAARKYDEATGQKNCEMEEKIAFIKKMAEYVGVDMTDVFATK